MCDNLPIIGENVQHMVIVTHIWQKLNNVQREVMLIVIHYWQLFSYIFGETSRIVTHIWPNRTDFSLSKSFHCSNLCSTWDRSCSSLSLRQRGESTRVITKESPASSKNLYMGTGET
jgi:hypothetical protein